MARGQSSLGTPASLNTIEGGFEALSMTVLGTLIAKKLSRIGRVMLGSGIDCFILINKHQISLTMECSGSLCLKFRDRIWPGSRNGILEVLSDVCVICAINALRDSDRDSNDIYNPS